MSGNRIKVLLVEDSYDYASMLQMVLKREGADQFETSCAGQLAQALSELDREQFDIILLDLILPDSEGLNTFIEVHARAPGVPIVVLTGFDDEALATRAVRHGAQDYLVKSNLPNQMLVRALRYAIERQRSMDRLQRLSTVDELTGLLNRRGFFSLARQHLKISRRSKRSLLLFYADLDGLKSINDRFGHQEGDQVLRTIAELLKTTFRSSDVIARLGGDEFTVLAIDTRDTPACMLARLQDNIDQFNADSHRYSLSLSVGVAWFDPESDATLEDLLAQADQALYASKKNKSRH